MQKVGLRAALAAANVFLFFASFPGWNLPRATADDVRVHVARGSEGALLLSVTNTPPNVASLNFQASTNLLRWELMGKQDPRTNHGFTSMAFNLSDPWMPVWTFYRALGETGSKLSVMFPSPANGERFYDVFTTPEPSSYVGQQLHWIKFVIPLDQPEAVYFQHGGYWPFHIDFLRAQFSRYREIDLNSLERIALRTNNQEVVLGALVFPPAINEYVGKFNLTPEYGIQLIGYDPFDREFALHMLQRVKRSINTGPDVQSFYYPSYEQAAVAELDAGWFKTNGFPVIRGERWLPGDVVYSAGSVFGRLRFIASTNLAEAEAAGELLPTDILVTDAVPSTVPAVAGIISFSAVSPNSHVVLLSQSASKPVVFIRDPGEQSLIRQASGEDRFMIARLDGAHSVELIGLEGGFPADVKERLARWNLPPRLNYQPKASFWAFSAAVKNIDPTYLKYFGGKAAGYGVLEKSIPDSAPAAVAFPFDLWDQFLNQQMDSGKTLREEISLRLSGLRFPEDYGQLRTNLADIRHLISKQAAFSPVQKSNILQSLEGFNPTKKIRFRSSTNVEDTESFNGAGLYESYSGCVMDDTDADATGPCQCEEGEPEERGVFRAMQKVYASFYNDSAYIERLRFGVVESEVGMAILVHPSYPDEMEAGNGVAVPNLMVNQLGAISVTNPDGSREPEIIIPPTYTRQYSSLLPLGSNVFKMPEDYLAFHSLFQRAAEKYRFYLDPTNQNLGFNFEYKKLTNGQLIVKQIRPVPRSPEPLRDRLLLPQTNRFVIYQFENRNVFDSHYLKSVWSFAARFAELNDGPLTASLFTNVTVQFRFAGGIQSYTGPLSALPEYSGNPGSNTLQWVDSWTWGEGSNKVRMRLITTVPSNEFGVLTPRELGLRLEGEFDQPQVRGGRGTDFGDLPSAENGFATNTNFSAELIQQEPVTNQLSPVERKTLFGSNLVVRAKFFHPAGTEHAAVTVPLVQWIETEITGLTAQPLLLRDYFSQTYRPYYDHWREEMLFEPALDSNVSAERKEELRNANIQFIFYVWTREFDQYLYAIGFDGSVRQVGYRHP
jgi:hypothetical protein